MSDYRMPPGQYLRLRREAAGLSIDDVAHRTALAAFGLTADVMALARFERGASGLSERLLGRLEGLFPFSRPVLDALMLHAADPDGGAPVPPVCTSCGCSWHDPCLTAEGPCFWRESAEPRYSACAPVAAGAAA